jgi:hypothetical protein
MCLCVHDMKHCFTGLCYVFYCHRLNILLLYTHLIVWLIKIYITQTLQFISNL